MVTMAEPRAAAFPGEWTLPADAGTTFMLDPMHFPFPLTPLTHSTHGPAFEYGFGLAAHEQNAPIEGYTPAERNWYHFERMAMKVPASEAEAREMGALAEASGKRELGAMADRWHQEHVPALKTHFARLRSMNVGAATDADIVAMLDEVMQIHCDLWLIHFRIAFPMLLGMQVFDEFYADVFGGADGDSHGLLLGVSSESVKAGLGLYDLAMAARQLGLEPLLRETQADELMAVLPGTEAGRAFTAKLNDYLDAYGYRQDLFDLATPTWREAPEIPLASVRNYLQTGRDEHEAYAANAASAETAIAAARAQIASYPEAVRGQFEGLLQAARFCSFSQEEHNFYIDQMGLSLIHLFYMDVGRKLVSRGLLDSPDEVFLFLFDELRALFANPTAANQVEHVRALTARRREELQIAAGLTPPPFIGDPPAGPPPGGNPMERGLMRFFGGPPQESEISNELKGNAGSRGIVSGPAKIARTLEEATGLKPGEILVAVTTMPAWTPLFGIAAAVVTETGGPLSHCAIVAREYGIPAVVGAHGATRAIANGQRITVDGGRGVVTLDG